MVTSVYWSTIATRTALAVLAVMLSTGDTVRAQDIGSLNPQPLPPLAHPNDPKTPAKELFGRKTTPASLQTHTIGFYAKGCLAGRDRVAYQWQDLAGDPRLA